MGEEGKKIVSCFSIFSVNLHLTNLVAPLLAPFIISIIPHSIFARPLAHFLKPSLLSFAKPIYFTEPFFH